MTNKVEQPPWIEEWASRIEASGFVPIAVPLLEIARAFGILGSQALLIVQPLASGTIAQTTIERTITLLESPELLEQLKMRLAGEEE